MKIYPELNKAIRAGAKITRQGVAKQTEAGIILAVCIALAGMVLLISLTK